MERVTVKFMLLLRLNRRGHFDVEYKSIHNLKRAKIQQKSLFYLMFYWILYSLFYWNLSGSMSHWKPKEFAGIKCRQMTNVQTQKQHGTYQLLAKTSQDNLANWQESTECLRQADVAGSGSKTNRNLHQCNVSGIHWGKGWGM